MAGKMMDVRRRSWSWPASPVIAVSLLVVLVGLPASAPGADYNFLEDPPYASMWSLFGFDCSVPGCMPANDLQHEIGAGVPLVGSTGQPHRSGYLLLKDGLDLERGLEIEVTYSVRDIGGLLGDGLSLFIRDANQKSVISTDPSGGAGESLGYTNAVRAGMFAIEADFYNKVRMGANWQIIGEPGFNLVGASSDQPVPSGFPRIQQLHAGGGEEPSQVFSNGVPGEQSIRIRISPGDYRLSVATNNDVGNDSAWVDIQKNIDLRADDRIRFQTHALQFGIGASTGDAAMDIHIRNVKVSALQSRYQSGSSGMGTLTMRGMSSSEFRLEKGDVATVCAAQYLGYVFGGWSDGNTNSCRSDNEAVDVVAVFVKTPPPDPRPGFKLRYSASTCGTLESQGTLENSSPSFVDRYFAVPEGKRGPDIIANPDPGCKFFRWSDGKREFRRTDYAFSHLDLQALFGYELVYQVTGRGALIGDFDNNSAVNVSYIGIQKIEKGGMARPVRVVADEGFEFVRWSDGVLTPYRQDINVQSDLFLTAEFREIGGYFSVRDSRTGEAMPASVSLDYGESYPVRVPSLRPDATITITRVHGNGDQTILNATQVAAAMKKTADGEYEFRVEQSGHYTVTFQDCLNGVCRATAVVFVVNPELYIPSVRQRAAAGGMVEVPVRLAEKPASFPVLVPYRVVAHADPAWVEGAVVAEGVLRIESASDGLEHYIPLSLERNAAGYRILQLAPDGQNYRLGSLNTHRILISPSREVPLAGALSGYDGLGNPLDAQIEYLLAPGDVLLMVAEGVGQASPLPAGLAWGAREPNNIGGMEHCAEVIWRGDYRPASVNDRDCDLKRVFTCVDKTGQWAFTAEAGGWHEGERACRAMDARYDFAMPANPVQLEAFLGAHNNLGPVAPEKAWLNYTDLASEGRWLNKTGRYEFDWSGSDIQLGLSGLTGSVASLAADQMAPGSYSLRVLIKETLSGRTLALEQSLRVLGQAAGPESALQSFYPVCPSLVTSRSDIAACAAEVPPATTLPWFMLGAGDMAAAQGQHAGKDFGLALSQVQDVETGMTEQTAEDVYGFYVDAQIIKLGQPGQVAPVVLPAAGLHVMAGTWVWFAGGEWRVFRQDYANMLSSAPLDWKGNCPTPWSEAWRAPVEGDACVRLLVEDGGANDVDGKANGKIRVVGGLAYGRSASPENLPDNGDITHGDTTESRGGGSGGGAAIFLVPMLIMAGVIRRRNLIDI